MRKTKLNLSALVIGLIALIGGIVVPRVVADTRAIDIGVDLSGCYVIEVNPQHVSSITYSTNSQSGVRMQYGDVDETHRVYYVSASDEPTNISITPNVISNLQDSYGIRSITDDTGKTLASAPRKSIIKTSDMTVGKVVTVNTLPLNEILTGRLTINYSDPGGSTTEGLYVFCSVGNNYNLNYPYSSFTDNSIEIAYDPLTENYWYLRNSKNMFIAKLDGKKKLSKSYLISGNSLASYAFSIPLGNEPGTHTVNAYASVIPMNVPMRFEFEQTTGNEKNPEYLSGMIESLTINGTKYTDKRWLEPGFTIPNGAQFSIGIKQQYRGIWEYEKAWFNDNALTYSSSSCVVETDDPNDVQVFRIRGMYNSNWRYTLNMTNPDRTRLEVNNSLINLPEGVSTYNGTSGFSAPALRPMGKNSVTEENPLAVYEVEVNGQTIPLDENGCYYPKEMDEVITVTPREYKRDIPIQVFCNLGYYSNYSITLDPRGQAKKIVPLASGWQTIMVNKDDLPFQTYSDDAAIYINGSMTPLVEQDGYAVFTGTKNLTANSKVKIFTSKPYINNVKLQVASGISSAITADDETISTGNQKLFQGTVIKFTPTQKTGLVVENMYGEYTEQAADGSITLTVDGDNTYTLHKTPAKITISCPSEKNIHVYNPANKKTTLLKGTVNEPYVFHYDESAQSYTLQFTDPNGKFNVSNITAIPSAGFTFDKAAQKATGIKDGMSLSLEISENVKGYGYDIYVNPEHDWDEGSETGLTVKYTDAWGDIQLEPLRYGSNKMNLQVTSFPIAIGPYVRVNDIIWVEDPDSGEMRPAPSYKFEVDENFYGIFYGYFGEEYNDPYSDSHLIDRQYDIVFENPTMVEGIIRDQYSGAGELIFNRDTDVDDFTYSADGGTFTRYVRPIYSYYDDPKLSIHAGGYATIHVDPDKYDTDHTKLIITDTNNNEEKYEFDSNGNVRIDFPTGDKFSSAYYASVEREDITLVFYLNGERVLLDINVPGVSDDGKDLMEMHHMFPIKDEIFLEDLYFTDIYISDDVYKIVGITDRNSGATVPFDLGTGKISNLTSYRTEDGNVDLDLQGELFVRDLTMTIYEDNTNYYANYCRMKAGATTQMDLTRNGATSVKFSREDMPIALSPYIMAGNGAARYYEQPYVYVNGELYIDYVYSKTLVPTPSLPYNLPDGSVIRIMQSANTGAVSYQIEDGIDVDIYHDIQKVHDLSVKEYTLAKNTVVKIKPAEGTDNSDFVVYRNGVKVSSADLEQGIVVTNATESISIEKPRNEITFVAGADTDLSKLIVSDSDGNSHELSATNNLLRLNPSIESLTILSAEEDHYISEVRSSESSMQYDLNTGLLTGLTTGTLTVTSKQIERQQEVNIYVDGGEMDGVQITLGSGKQIETGQSLGSGNSTVQFSEEDLPIILQLPDSYLGEDGTVPTDPKQLPTVMVNGEVLTYSPEHNGYVFPVEAFSDPANPPVIKIYPAEPEPVGVVFLVEPGVTFTAVPDGDEAQTVSEAGEAMILPGTTVEVKAKSVKPNESIFVEVNGEVISRGTEVNYTFQVTSEGNTIELKREKVGVTINSDDAWRFIHVSGGGFSYPLYDASSEFEFPVGTESLTFRSLSDTQRVAQVINATTGNPLTFDVETGVVSGVTDKMKLSLEMGDVNRDKELTIYVHDETEMPKITLTVAEGKAVQKEMWLQPGYQKMLFGDSDLPMAVNCESEMKVYVNNELISYSEANGYEFPETLPTNSVVKIFVEEKSPINVKYNVDHEFFDIEIKHDHAQVVDLAAATEHNVLPGTEITFAIQYKNPEMAQLVTARRAAAKKAAEENGVDAQSASDSNTELNVNGVALTPEEDGTYLFKVAEEHRADGLNFTVKRPDFVDETGCVYSADKKTLLSVPADTEGTVTILPGVTTIAEGAFNDCTKVTSVEMPESLETISDNAFSGCTGLTEVFVPNNVTTIGDGAFSGCSELKTVILGSGVETVSETAFENCDNLTKSAYPASLEPNPFPAEVPVVAYEATDIKVVDGCVVSNSDPATLYFVPATVEGEYTVPAGVEVIAEGALSGCSKITEVIVPDEVKTIEAEAFSGCTALETVILGVGVSEVAEDAFTGCENITKVAIPAALAETLGEKVETLFPTTEGEDGKKNEVATVVYTAPSTTVDPETGFVYSIVENEGKTEKILVFVPADAEGESGTFTIPEDVTAIGDGAFKGCDNISEVVIPENVKEIGAGAFEGCDKIEKVTIAEGVETIGSGAFSGTSITEVVIPDSVTEIGDDAFKGCDDLTSVTIGENVETIGSGAFSGTSITNIVVPDNVTAIGDGAFSDCENLTSVILGTGVASENANIGEGLFEGSDNIVKAAVPAALEEKLAEEGKPLFPTKEDENGETVSTVVTVAYTAENTKVDENGNLLSGDGTTLLYVPADEKGDYTVPETVTSIGDGAFKGCEEITEVNLPENLESIGSNAFEGCSGLTSLDIPETVKEIGDGAFKDCNNITEIDTSHVENLGEGVFEGCEELTTVTLPDTITEIGAGEFEGCTNLTTVNIPETVTTIGENAFSGCTNLENVNIPEGVTSIGENAFSGCTSLTEVEIPNTVTEIGNGAFEGCTSLETVTVPEGVTTVGDNAFSGCTSLTEVEIPSTVKEIGNGAFEGCEKLTNVNVPEGVETIGENAFSGCSSLTQVEIPSTVKEIGNGAFEGCTSLETVTVPEGVTTVGENAFNGCTSLTEVEIPSSVTEIGNGAFQGCTGLETVTIQGEVSTIGENAFSGCTSLTEVKLPETVEEIGSGAFEGCSNLETVNIPDGVTTIGENAFKGCEDLKSVAIPPTTTEVGTGAFEGCTNLNKAVYPDTLNEPFGEGVGVSYPADQVAVTEDGVILTPETIYFVPADVKEVEIPETVTTIVENAFRDCKELTTVEIPQSVTAISADAFSGCTSLTEVSVPNQVTEIQSGAFSGCTALTEVNLGSSVTSIGENAFSGCSELKEVNVHSNVTAIGKNAFSDCALTDIHLGAGIQSIGENAFAGNNISVIAISAQTPPTLGANAFGSNSSAALYVQGSAAEQAYGAAAGWSGYVRHQMIVASELHSDEGHSIVVKTGEPLQLHIIMDPENATMSAIFWESSNPSLVTVDNKGLVQLVPTDEEVEATVEADEAPMKRTPVKDDVPVKILAKTMYDNGPTYEFTVTRDIVTGVDRIMLGGEGYSLEELISEGDVYTISGIKVDPSVKHLDRGIYIIKVNGKSFTVAIR